MLIKKTAPLLAALGAGASGRPRQARLWHKAVEKESHMFRLGSRSVAKLTSALALITALGGAVALPASASPAIFSFGYTGGMQTWVVPDGITSARFNLYGAAGGEPHIAG